MQGSTGHLGIHVIGKGFGESIVIELPNGSVGVVDCYASNLARPDRARESNPVLRFLDKNYPSIESLAFLALTHPHEDHGRGMSQILKAFKGRIDQIWIFDLYKKQGFDEFLKALLPKLVKGGSDISGFLPYINRSDVTFAEELHTIRSLVDEQVHGKLKRTAGGKRVRQSPANPSRLIRFRDYQQTTISDEPVTVHFLGPSTKLLDRYESDLSAAPNSVNHNHLAPVIVIEYCSLRVVLGSDVEEESWSEILSGLADRSWALSGLDCHFLKVSHHGSTNGYTPELYAHFAHEGGRPIAAVTPYNRGRSPLPSPGGIDHIGERVSALYITRSSDAIPAEVPGPWLSKIRERPELAGVLHESLIPDGGVAQPLVDLPREWVHDIKEHPEWSKALRPDLCQGLANELKNAPEDQCRLSFYFDENGQLDRNVFQGSGTERLR